MPSAAGIDRYEEEGGLIVVVRAEKIFNSFSHWQRRNLVSEFAVVRFRCN